MKNILTPEEKKYLSRICNYLNSLGMKTANIDFEIDGERFDFNNINWNRVTHFDNNYNADIPEGLIPILNKIMSFIDKKNLYERPSFDSINYERIETLIDTDSKEISVSHYYSYYDEGDTSGTEWSLEENPEDESIAQIFQDLDELDSDESVLVLSYNGGGDSGYIESEFDEGGSVPASVEDWAYRELENLHGGWEINEGSNGYFTFDIPNKTIELTHTYNTEESVSDTIFEENFGE